MKSMMAHFSSARLHSLPTIEGPCAAPPAGDADPASSTLCYWSYRAVRAGFAQMDRVHTWSQPRFLCRVCSWKHIYSHIIWDFVFEVTRNHMVLLWGHLWNMMLLSLCLSKLVKSVSFTFRSSVISSLVPSTVAVDTNITQERPLFSSL